MSKHMEDREETVEMSGQPQQEPSTRCFTQRRARSLCGLGSGKCTGQGSFLSRDKQRVAFSPKKPLTIHSPNIH